MIFQTNTNIKPKNVEQTHKPHKNLCEKHTLPKIFNIFPIEKKNYQKTKKILKKKKKQKLLIFRCFNRVFCV